MKEEWINWIGFSVTLVLLLGICLVIRSCTINQAVIQNDVYKNMFNKIIVSPGGKDADE